MKNAAKGLSFLRSRLSVVIPVTIALLLALAPFLESNAEEMPRSGEEKNSDSQAASITPDKLEGTCVSPPCDKKRAKLPSFRMVFHNTSGQTHILVSSRTSEKEIENLIYYLAEVRKINGLEKIGIPPSGIGGYERGSVLIFKEIRWARGEKLTNPRLKEKTYDHHVKAEYIWNLKNEIAYLGKRTLFSNNLTPP